MPARAPRRAARLLLAAAVAVALSGVLAACGDVSWEPQPSPVPGAGNLTTEDRTAGDFTRVSVGAKVKVVAREAPELKVTVEAQQNLLPLIKTEVLDGQLVVNIPPPGVSTSQPITVTIDAPMIESFTIGSGATGYVEVVGDRLNLDASGGATLTAIGDIGDARLTTSASSHAEMAELKVARATVALSDGSSATMNVVSSVTGTASGGSTLTLVQKPASVAVETSGGATVQGG